jgi:hypothetical protein
LLLLSYHHAYARHTVCTCSYKLLNICQLSLDGSSRPVRLPTEFTDPPPLYGEGAAARQLFFGDDAAPEYAHPSNPTVPPPLLRNPPPNSSTPFANRGTNYGAVNPSDTPASELPSNLQPKTLEQLWFRILLVVISIITLRYFYTLGRTQFYPMGANWSTMTAASNCSAIGVREWTASLHHIPSSWSESKIRACALVPISLPGSHRREVPNTCDEVEQDDGSVETIGYWIVEDTSCQSTWGPVIPGDCTTTSLRSHSAKLSYLPPGVNPVDACEHTPLYSPSGKLVEKQCLGLDSGTDVIARYFEVDDDEFCIPKWGMVNPGNCTGIGQRSYTVSFEYVPPGIDALNACERMPIPAASVREKHCTVSLSGEVIASGVSNSEDDFFCHPTWGPIIPGNCTTTSSQSYSAKIGYLPPGVNAIDACEHTPLYSPSGELLGKYCSALDSGSETIARGLLDTDHCKPSLVDAHSRCSAASVRDHTSKVHIPAGLDPLYACQNTLSVFDGRSLPPDECILVSGGVEAHWYRSGDSECTPLWANSPTADAQCLSYGLRRYTSILRYVPVGLHDHAACLDTPAHIKEQRWRKPDQCEETSDGLMRGIWIVDFDVPECVTELGEISDKGCAHSLRVSTTTFISSITVGEWSF